MTTKPTKKERVRILWCKPMAGPLYRVQAEDGELYCYDWTFRAATTIDGVEFDGRTFEHATYVVHGAVKNPDGYWVANYNHKKLAEEFCNRVETRGSIVLSHWVETTGKNFDLEAALKEEAARERFERGGRY
jgi:hypothetical protein